MLELKEGTIAADGHILIESFSFVAKAGEITCLTGTRGVGKTLLLHALMGLWPLEKGYVTIDGEPVTPRSAPWLRRWIAYIPQLQEAGDPFPWPSTIGKRILLVDDPFLILSSESSENLYQKLWRLSREGMSVVVTCHENDLVYLPECQTYSIAL